MVHNYCDQEWQYGRLVRYGTPKFLTRSTVRWYGTFFCKGTGTVRWYGTLQKLN